MKCCIKDFFSKSAGNCGLVIFANVICCSRLRFEKVILSDFKGYFRFTRVSFYLMHGYPLFQSKK